MQILVDWVPKEGVELRIPCPECNGKYKRYGGEGWGCFEEPDVEVWRCSNCTQGTIRNPEVDPKPRMPEVFKNYLRGYYKKFMDKYAGEGWDAKPDKKV